MTQRVFIDANVLYSRTLRDWLFQLRLASGGGIFQLHTTWDVITEAGAKLRDNHPAADGRLVAGVMEKVETCVDEVLSTFPGGSVQGVNDAGDWHVHHAAEACRAHILLTEDKGFASNDTHYEVYSCDEFFLEVARSAPETVKRVVDIQAHYWATKNGKQLPEALREARCEGFADVVLGHLKQLATAGSNRP